MKEPQIVGTEFEENAEGEWFPFFTSKINEQGVVTYDDPKQGAGRARIRSLTPFFEERRAGRKKKSEYVLNPQTRSMERVSYFEDLPPAEQKKETEDAWDYCITGLENFYIGKNLVNCDRAGKLELMKRPVFDRFIGRCLQLLAAAGVKEKDETEKN